MKTMSTSYIAIGLGCLVLFVVFGANIPIAQAATVCNGGSCYYVACQSNADCGQSGFVGFQTCQQNAIYQSFRTFTCNNAGTQESSCTTSYAPRLQATCGENQACNEGKCYEVPTILGTTAQTTGAGYCMPQAAKKCVSNISYWYNSCGALESVAQNCNTTNQVCQSGQCVAKAPTPTPTSPSFVKRYRQQCYNNSVYWYNSNGTVEDVAKDCNDNNSCTQDSCGDLKCSNTLKCDGSTCQANSDDFKKYCANVPGTGEQASGLSLSVAIIAKKDSEKLEWSKSVTANQNEKVSFLITVKNTSTSPINNVMVRADITDQVEYTGNLEIDNAALNANIINGIDLGALSEKTSKVISFTGTVKKDAQKSALQITASATSGTTADSDIAFINVGGPQVKNNFAAALGSSPLVQFLKRSWFWIIVTIILIGLFIVIFRRLSTNV